MTEKMPQSCRFCGAEVPQRSGRGRPAIYCRVGHRRAAEHEIARQGRRIERLQTLLDSAEREVAVSEPYVQDRPRRELEVITRQVQRAIERLVTLLDDPNYEETP